MAAMASICIGRSFRLRRNIAKERRRFRRGQSLSVGPVIAYGHPRTATRSNEGAIAMVSGVEAFHAHVLHPNHFTTKNNTFVSPLCSGLCPEDQPSQWCIAEAIKLNEQVTLVSAVRDPVAVNVSWFFLGLQRWLKSPRPVDLNSIPFDTLKDLFRTRFPHNGILSWFTEEWSAVTGIELDALDGVRRDGYATARFGNGHACVFSAHLPDQRKSEILGSVLGLKGDAITFPRLNQGSNRPSSEIYDRLKILVASDADYLDRMYASAYSRRFFSPNQVENFRESWRAIADMA